MARQRLPLNNYTESEREYEDNELDFDKNQSNKI